MRILVVQFAPKLGRVADNRKTCERLLKPFLLRGERADLVVLPELALSGYNHQSRHAIAPFLEILGRGPSHDFAMEISRKLQATVVIGWPERDADCCYNSALMVNDQRQYMQNYRKKHLFTTDETWANEGSDFGHVYLPTALLPAKESQASPVGVSNTVSTALGICMDLNPYKFEAPWNAYEFANHINAADTQLVIVPMAWLKGPSGVDDLSTLRYWVSRLGPAWTDKQLIFVAANFTGQEGSARYAGDSCVLASLAGEVNVRILGRLRLEEGIVDVNLQEHGVSIPNMITCCKSA